jgi:membrane-bound lytic murein transglycosylase D
MMRPPLRRILLLLLLAVGARLAPAAEALLPRPPELEPAVQFWIRVYTEISTSEGFIHDQRNLAIVYETLRFGEDESPRERQRRVDAARERYQAALRRLASGAAPETAEERRVREVWGANVSSARLALAVDDVRFQLGQSDRFRAGLKRAGAWEAHIAETLANRGLPEELAALPHVESSFNPEAYSKVGASGLWQFMRSTGRLFLRIDRAVDERLDPFRSTEAAAQLLSYNYRVLGTWPLAITAYNHGAAGVRRAKEQVGSDDIVRIVREYHSPSFGFASRNFYVSFLAALAIDREPEKYFGPIERLPEKRFREVMLPAATPMAALERALGVEGATLRALNPALLPAVWRGQRTVPRGYRLRLPESATAWTSEMLAQRLGARPETQVAATVQQTPEPAEGGSYVVRRGDTLSAIAARTGLSAQQLMDLNALRDQDHIFEGQRLRISAAPGGSVPPTPAETASVARAVAESRAEARAADVAEREAARAEPVSAAQAAAQGPTLVPGAMAATAADVFDYSVSDDGAIRVAAAETLGHYADWLGVGASRLRRINGLHARSTVVIGQRLRLDFRRVPREQFEQRRREYHERLQAEYFATHRITGTEVYIARRGDSLWSLTKGSAGVPVWLLQQFNPDLDFGDLKPGAQVILPRIETLSDV